MYVCMGTVIICVHEHGFLSVCEHAGKVCTHRGPVRSVSQRALTDRDFDVTY